MLIGKIGRGSFGGMLMRSVLLIGGTGEIGSEMVRQFRHEGSRVTFTYSTSREEASRLSSTYGCDSFQLDLREDIQLPAGLTPDILVYNAAINLSGQLVAETTDSEILTSFTVNTLGAVRVVRQVLPAMIKREWGRVISVNSLYGLTSPPLKSSYSISKYGLSAMTKSLALEAAAQGITVNEVCLGPVDSRMLRELGDVAIQSGLFADMEAYLESVVQRVPIGRLIQPDEVAAAVLFLASSAAAACTGVSLRIDGGVLT
jgi:3-oxoacyl-[acyl-carrier protein] reductase